MKTSDQLDAITAALSAAQAELEDATKDKANPHFKSKYADITGVLQAIRPVFGKHGLAFVQGLSTAADGSVEVTTRIMHKSGEWIEDTLTVPLSKRDAQGVGSASTYGRRYGLTAMVGLGQEDDDGNAAASSSGASKKATKKAEATPDEVAALKADFAKATTTVDIAKLAARFSALSPAQQTQVLPDAKAARERVGL